MSQITTARQLFDVAVLESANVSAKQVLESGATHIAMDEDRRVHAYKMKNGKPKINEQHSDWLPGCNGNTVHYIGEVPRPISVNYRTACFQIPDDFAQVK